MKIVFSLLLIIGFCPITHAELDALTFEELQAELKPDLTESWRQIPWKISVIEAQQIAAAELKPLFIWAMDGHPLGCT